MRPRDTLAARRSALVGQWVDRTFATYPPEAARLMAAHDDPFRNPAGHTLRQSLEILFDAVILGDDWATARSAVDDLVRLRAVQDFSADQAVAFIGMLQAIVERDVGACADVADRLARLTDMARASYAECRSRIEAARTHELRRRTWTLTRVRGSDGSKVRRSDLRTSGAPDLGTRERA